jgi:hypothetical protein
MKKITSKYMLPLGCYAVLCKRITVNCVNMTLAIARNDNSRRYSHILCSILEMSETKEAQNLTANECNNDHYARVHAHTSHMPRFLPRIGICITFCVVA